MTSGIIGGIDSAVGAILSSLFVEFIPVISSDLAMAHDFPPAIIYVVVLVAVIFLTPDGFVGPTSRLGGQSPPHVRRMPAIARNPNTRVVAAADTSPDALEAFRARCAARGYASLEDLCQDADVDAVYIATPTHLHTQYVLTAVAAGKHVICEETLAITLEDADKMIAAVEKSGVQFIVGQSQSYEPPIRTCELVRSGEIGPLGVISGWYFNDWLYPPRLAAELDTTNGGGVVFRKGAHLSFAMSSEIKRSPMSTPEQHRVTSSL